MAILYFTHGTLLQQLSALNEENSKQEWAKYCSISAVEMGLNKSGKQMQRQLSFDINNDHVKEKVSYDVLTQCKQTQTKPAPIPDSLKDR